jgi:hypothetical protein
MVREETVVTSEGSQHSDREHGMLPKGINLPRGGTPSAYRKTTEEYMT